MPAAVNHPSQISLLLQSRGPSTARELAAAVGVSQPTISRALKELDRQHVLERMGASRSAKYALRRSVRHLGRSWPIMRVDESGHARLWAEMTALHAGYRVAFEAVPPDWASYFPEGYSEALPFFLQDLRPMGYLGLAIARACSDRLGVPLEVSRWQDDDILTYLVTDGDDLPGDLMIGNLAIHRWYQRADQVELAVIREEDAPLAYPRLANAAQRGELVGSSAGGEQPKFTATLRRGEVVSSVLVKFSAAEPSPVSQRWADLLLAEHHAAGELRAAGIACAVTRVLDAAGRRFLEVERFDRIGATGRRGVVTLGTVEDALAKESWRDWSAAASVLQREGLIDAENARRLRWIWCFGSLIANTDMHRANASLWLSDRLPFRLAPTYDMLPMHYAPGPQGVLAERDFTPTPPLPSLADVWVDAAQAAANFWRGVQHDAAFSDAFRRIAEGAGKIVDDRIRRLG